MGLCTTLTVTIVSYIETIKSHNRQGHRMLSYTITTATADDAVALGRLAALDSAAPVGLPALVAEIDGRPVAAIELASGRVIADPFVPTLDARALLELRRAAARAD